MEKIALCLSLITKLKNSSVLCIGFSILAICLWQKNSKMGKILRLTESSAKAIGRKKGAV